VTGGDVDVINLSTMTDERPSPGFPDPLSPLLAVIVQGALESLESGEINAEGAILQAAVQAWFEGHIEGEECSGCDARSDGEDQDDLRRYPS
jgi:hypothetical protein